MGYKSPFGEKSPFKETSENSPKAIIITADPTVLARINQEKQEAKKKEEKESIKELFLSDKEIKAIYETDGHYSTVYLVCQMLGMNNEFANELAVATEAPDTTIHSETKFELNDTWGDMDGSQQEIHSLTGGFHGVEEFFTAIKFLYLPNENVMELGKLLHRFGDTYAHTQINNLKPDDIKEKMNLKGMDVDTIKKYIDSWKVKSEKSLKSSVEPWIKFFNYYLEKDGFNFLNNETKQIEIFKGKTLKEVLKDIYLVNQSKDFIMYGKDGYTPEHFVNDGGYPDQIYVRPNWYRLYVQNLAWLIATKYKLDIAKLDLHIFDKMISFVSIEKCSMKGIIDYEIAKKLGKKEIYIPVFYAGGSRFLASLDAVFINDYLQIAKDVLEKTKKYILEQGVSILKIEEIKTNSLITKVSIHGVFTTEAFKITII